MKRGDIIIVEYPFTNRSGSKHRPALVVQSDAVSSRDVLIAAISASAAITRARVAINPVTETKSNLRMPCVVRGENITMVEMSMVLGSIDSLSKRTMRSVDQCLRRSLGL